MILYTRNRKPIEIEIGGPVDDLQITAACYVNAPQLQVPDHVCDYLLDAYASDIYMERIDQLVGQAEYLYEGER